jgi:hypothetical protein
MGDGMALESKLTKMVTGTKASGFMVYVVVLERIFSMMAPATRGIGPVDDMMVKGYYTQVMASVRGWSTAEGFS